jgi:predicted ester cyclase/ketosteroid isomerase-like protein
MMTTEERKRKVREAGERRVEIVQAIFSAHASRDVAQLGAHFADDAQSTWVDHVPARAAHGRKQLVGAWEAAWTRFPTLEPRPALVLVNENHAVAFATLAGSGQKRTGRDPAPGGWPGAAFSLYFGDWEAGDDRIRCEEIFDPAALEGHPGFAPPEGASTAPATRSGALGDAAASHVSSDADTERIHLAVVNAMNAGLKIRELDAPLEHYAERAALRRLSDATDHIGKQAIRKSMEDRYAVSPDAKLDRSYAWCADRWVVAEYTWSGTHDRSLAGGRPPTGKPFSLRELHLFEVVNDKIEQQWIFGQSFASVAHDASAR